MKIINELIDIKDDNILTYINKCEYPYEIVSKINYIVLGLQKILNRDDYNIDGDIWIGKNVIIEDGVSIKGPCIIMDGVTLRHCSYIRGNALIYPGCVVGNSTEIKNAILFEGVQVPHFNYVGDSILGNYSHLGAGAIISNVKSDNSNVKSNYKDIVMESNMRKLGAILGDHVEVGCNCVICPGTIIDRETSVYPLTRVRGYIKENSIVKSMDNIVEKYHEDIL